MTNEEFKQFKSAISITAVAKMLGVQVLNGKCRCFFPQRHVHGDRTPSVSISENHGNFRCWVCDDVHGDVISLVQILKDCSFTEAVKWLTNQYPFLLSNATRKEIATLKDAQRAQIETEKESLVSDDERKKIILSFLKRLSPVDGTAAARWLARRRIYKPVWDKMLLRTITDYESVSNSLKQDFGEEILKSVGLFNEKGHLRYYKHPLIFPYLDKERRAFYFQARALDKLVEPKELNLQGTVPFPYNLNALDKKPGWVYLCEGVVDTLTFLGQKINAVGIPGVRSFKVEWLSYFNNKNVVLCLDHDEAGYSGMKYIGKLFSQAGIHNVILGEGLQNLPTLMKEGEDINDWFGGKK